MVKASIKTRQTVLSVNILFMGRHASGFAAYISKQNRCVHRYRMFFKFHFTFGATVAQSVHWLRYRLGIPGFSSRKCQETLLQNIHTSSGGPHSPLFSGYGGLFPLGYTGRRLRLTIFQSSSEVKIQWICTSTTLYALMAYTETA